jgi:hypothetical protein
MFHQVALAMFMKLPQAVGAQIWRVDGLSSFLETAGAATFHLHISRQNAPSSDQDVRDALLIASTSRDLFWP